jgi:hypothetical protein
MNNCVMTSTTFIPARYRVRQTFFSFGTDCEETFSTIGEAEAYGRAIAEDLAQAFFQTSDDYVDVPYRSPFNAIGYSNGSSVISVDEFDGFEDFRTPAGSSSAKCGGSLRCKVESRHNSLRSAFGTYSVSSLTSSTH